jgi:hypothetical protein
MIASFHLADVGKLAALRLLRTKIAPSDVPGLRYALVTTTAPLSAHLLPKPRAGRVGLIALWEDDLALEGFLATHPVAERLADGWHVRLQPKRVVGAWAPLPPPPVDEEPMDATEPSAALTIGRLRLSQTVRFLRASAAAESLAVRDPALLAGTGLASLPAQVATFTLWRSTAAMSAYALGQAAPGHLAAIRAHGAKPFHHESAFIRFRPYAAQGKWDGRDPLALATAPPATDPALAG